MNKETLWEGAPKGVLTTGIGSLPHACVDSALQFSFNLKIPFLPQIPIRNPDEFMVKQAIDMLPGVSFREGGYASLNSHQWGEWTHQLRERTDEAFNNADDAFEAFELFEPSPEVWSAWTPFLWELQERKVRFAKIQIAGPLTCQWALRLSDGVPADTKPEIGMQVFRLILARSIAMCRRLKSFNVTPLIFLDEPGFYGFSSKNAKQLLGLQELKLFIQSLQKEQVLVGVHCCSNTDWAALLSLPMDVLSLDTNLSLNVLLQEKEAVKKFVGGGGRFSFGIVPTGTHILKIRSFQAELLYEDFMEVLKKNLGDDDQLIKQVVSKALFTPACGLALHSIEDSEAILSHLIGVSELCEKYLA